MALATEGSIEMRKHHELVDSIINNVMLYSAKCEKIISSYDAELYMKRSMQIKKKNYLIHFAPFSLRGDKKLKNSITESLNELHYSAPNIYNQKVKAITGNSLRLSELSDINFPFFHINIYSSSLLYDKVISPVTSSAKRFYRYRLINTTHLADGTVEYKILIIPKNNSYQLVSGYMIVNDSSWRVTEIELRGRSEYMHYDVKMWMGKEGDEESLPVKYQTGLYISMLGNVIDINYAANLKYNNIKLTDLENSKIQKRHFDISESFSLSCENDSCVTDSSSFSKLRPYPLSDSERMLYRDYAIQRDSLHFAKKRRSIVVWGEMGDFLLNNYTVNLSSLGSVRCSPIINPFLMGYSHENGLSYKQVFKYNHLFPDDRFLHIVPKIGYNFKRRELYWSITSDYDYWPEKRAALHLSFGNGNRIYSSKVVENIKNIPDSLFNFDNLHLDYFRDFYVDFNHSVEVANGFFARLGVTIHQRDAVKPSTIVILTKMPLSDANDFLDGLKSRYVSFAPRFQLEWTPGQYYYMKGKRKVNLYSNYPTFSLDYERGLKGVMGSTGQYERLEFDMQHHIKLDLLRDIYYRFGVGGFTNTHELYFVDYANLSKNNLPLGWNDDIGGVFQLLDSRWYNSSNRYIRAHFTYETPFLLLRHLKEYTRSVINERIYISALSVPHLNPYLEFGYGIGTHVFDAGAFVSFAKTSFQQVGFKFTFELFNR